MAAGKGRCYNLGQNKREQQTPHPPQIKDEVARRVKTRHFPILDLGGRGRGLGFPFILSKIVGFSQRNRILCREDKFFNS